jgi:hypothetical protein
LLKEVRVLGRRRLLIEKRLHGRRLKSRRFDVKRLVIERRVLGRRRRSNIRIRSRNRLLLLLLNEMLGYLERSSGARNRNVVSVGVHLVVKLVQKCREVVTVWRWEFMVGDV